MITQQDIIIRLVLATFLGGVIGAEREYQNRPAGLRTHVLVSTTSCLIMLLGILMSETYRNNDPSRIAAQVVSGIGFLGAGTIIQTGSTIKGLTTAATLWANAGIGLAVGAGYYFASSVTVGIAVITLFALSKMEERISFLKNNQLDFVINPKSVSTETISRWIEDLGGDIVETKILRHENAEDQVDLNFILKEGEELPIYLLKEKATPQAGILQMTYKGEAQIDRNTTNAAD